jgi:hypothetical protein
MNSRLDDSSPALLAISVLIGCALLIGLSHLWPDVFSAKGVPSADVSLGLPAQGNGFDAPAAELVKLMAAGFVGILVTSVYRRYNGDRPVNRPLMQASVLLCMSGALMMIIIGNSMARALGIAGGASIIRFRTPVDDPRDTILLFLLLGLGMSLGLGAFAVCGLATLFLCAFLPLLDRYGDVKPRTLMLDLVSTTKEFPLEHVHRILGAHTEFYEPLKVAQGAEAAMRFCVRIDPSTSLAWLSNALLNDGAAGLKSVTWDPPKKAES